MKKAYGIVGWSGSGKTNLACRIISHFTKKKIKVASIKHSHHTFQVDKEGKDSFKHAKAGSNEVIIYNEHKFAMIGSLQKKSISLRSMISKISKDTEIILVEGLKYSSLKKLEVYRADLNKPILCHDDKKITCLVYDKKFEGFEKIKIPKFQFYETIKICDFLQKQFKNEK